VCVACAAGTGTFKVGTETVGTSALCLAFAAAPAAPWARVSVTFLLDKVSPALNDAAIQSFAVATQNQLSSFVPTDFDLPVLTFVKSTTTTTATHKNIITTYVTYNVTASIQIPHFATDSTFPEPNLDYLYNNVANPSFLDNVVNYIMFNNPTDPILANLVSAIVDPNSFDDYLSPLVPAAAADSKKQQDLAIPLGVGLGLPLGIFLVVGVLYCMHKNNMLGDNSAKPPSKDVEMSAGHHVQVATGDNENHGQINEI